MKNWIATFCFAALLAAAGTGSADTIDWKGVTWTLDNVTAVVNPDGSITLTSLVTHSHTACLHANRLSDTFESVMDPWIMWSFTGHKGDILIEKEDTVEPGGPTIQAGSLWDNKWAVTRYTAVGGSRPEQYFIWSPETSIPISHVVNIGKRLDGTVDAKFDSDSSSASTFLKDNVGGAWGFQDVYLRMRDATVGDTITFNDFQFGGGHAPWDVWVDDSGDDGNPGTEAEPLATIQKAIEVVDSGGTIHVGAGTYFEVDQIVIDKDVTIAGEDSDTTIVKPDHDTTVSGYVPSDGWIYVPPAVSFVLRDVTLDGTDLGGNLQTIRHAIQSRGELTVEDCVIRNIKAGTYYGRGILLLAGTGNSVKRCELSDIQRIGIHVRGNVEPTNPVAYIEDCTYTGKGDGDWLDYGVEFGGGGSGTVTGCSIYDCTGVASADGSTSAGILITDYWGTGTAAEVYDSTIAGCSTGIYLGYSDTDASTLTASNNNLIGNDTGIISAGANMADAVDNWWGHASGPYDPDGSDETDGVTCYDPSTMANADGLGDLVSDAVDYCPWLSKPYGDNILALMVTDASLYIKPSENAVIDMDVFNLIQKVLGCQAMLNFDSTYFGTGLTDVSVQPGGGPWDEVIYDIWDAGGDLDVAVGVEVNVSGSSSGTDADGTVAKITLAPTGVEGTTQMVFRADVPDDETQQTMLVDMNSAAVWPVKLDSLDIVIDGTDPLAADLAATEDQGSGPVDVLDCAGTTLQGTVSITVDAEDALAGLDGVPGIDVRHSDAATTLTATLVDDEGPTFGWTVTVDSATKNGTYTIMITAVDKAGNSTVVTGTLCVNKNQVAGEIELDSLNPPAGITRTATFVATGGVQKSWNVDLDFDPGADTAAFTLTDVPDGSTHLSAKTDWNLRSKVVLGGGGDNQWTADLTGGNKLLGGDLNGSNAINILDFAVLRTHWYTTDTEADIDGSGQVNLTDFGILRINWFKKGDSL